MRHNRPKAISQTLLVFILLCPLASPLGGCATARNTDPAGDAVNANGRGIGANGNNPALHPSDSLSDSDRGFILDAEREGLEEVEFSRLAAQRASSVAVKRFAERLVDGHTRVNDDLRQVARSKGLPPLKELDVKLQDMLERLSKRSGEEFDRAYMRDMIEDHTDDVANYRREAEGGSDQEVKAFAGRTLPVLEEHLRLAREIMGTDLKGAVPGGAKK